MIDPDQSGAFIFRGSWREYAPIAFTNLLLIIVTLGTYRFWAKARERRYLWSHTDFLDDPLEWTGTGKELFVGFLFAILLFGPPLLLLQFGVQALAVRGHPGAALLVFALSYAALMYIIGVARFRALRYRLSRTWWHGIRGGSNVKGWRFGLSAMWKPVAATLSLGLLMPWSMMGLWNERWRSMSFGSLAFAANGRARSLIGRYLILYILWPVLTAILLYAALSTFGIPLGGVYFYSNFPPEFRMPVFLALLFVLFMIGAIGLLYYYAAYIEQAIGHLRLGSIELEFDASIDDWLHLFVGDIALLIGTLGTGSIFLGYRHWRFLITHLQAGGEISLAELTQSQTGDPTQGEGLLDAFDVGAF